MECVGGVSKGKQTASFLMLDIIEKKCAFKAQDLYYSYKYLSGILMMRSFIPDDFPHIRHEKVRYSDTDRQGHVNNAVFSTFLECARTDILYDKSRGLIISGRELVIVQIEIEFLAEVAWPGTVEIGSRVKKIGHSSIVFEQAIFQAGKCASVSTNVMVMIDAVTRKSIALPEDVMEGLADVIKEP